MIADGGSIVEPPSPLHMPDSHLTVAITGPTGTFGFGLMPLLQADERIGTIVGIARRPFDASEHGWAKMTYRQGDVRDRATLEAAFQGADVVVHLAFMITGAASRGTIRQINVEGTLNAFRAALAAGARRFVYASSGAVYQTGGLPQKRAYSEIRASTMDGAEYWYVPSLSHKTLVYKGMLNAMQLRGYYPDLTLSGAYGYIGDPFIKQIAGENPAWSYGLSIAQTLFNGGLTAAEVEAARDTYVSSVASYRQTRK